MITRLQSGWVIALGHKLGVGFVNCLRTHLYITVLAQVTARRHGLQMWLLLMGRIVFGGSVVAGQNGSTPKHGPINLWVHSPPGLLRPAAT